MLTEPEEQALVRRAQRGDRTAQGSLLMAFEGLVGSLARRYASKEVELEELESAGTEALWAALGRLASYDPAQGRLATWLGPSLTHAIQAAAGREAQSRRALEARRQDDEGEAQESELERQGRIDPELAAYVGEEAEQDSLSQPGRASARDPYLRMDRFSDVKEILLVRLLASDRHATIHEATWQKMTRSPALASLLEEVRRGEASPARLEQEYRNLAPAEHVPQAPRVFTLRDERSRALARITRRAAEAGSLPERARWAAAGVMDAESEVQHFRRWVLGGEPSGLWPDLAERFLAAEHWVEGQAKLEATPDPEYVLAYGESKLRAVARGGALDALRHCAHQLERDFGWREERAVRFILTGFAEQDAKLQGRVHAGGLYGARARIVMEVDPRTSPAEVARLYTRWREALARVRGERCYPDRDRQMNEKTLALATFVEERWQPAASWRDLRASWNEDHLDWRFPEEAEDPAAKNFANHARQAWSRLSGARWPTGARAGQRAPHSHIAGAADLPGASSENT